MGYTTLLKILIVFAYNVSITSFNSWLKLFVMYTVFNLLPALDPLPETKVKYINILNKYVDSWVLETSKTAQD